MSRFDVVLSHIILGDGKRISPYGRLFVVSAYAGITDMLLEPKHLHGAGVYTFFALGGEEKLVQKMSALLKHMKAWNERLGTLGLIVAAANAFIEGRMEDLRGFLVGRLRGGEATKKKSSYLWGAREALAAVGEVHAAFNTVAILEACGVRAVLVDLSDVGGSADFTIDERIRVALEGMDYGSCLPILTGYTRGKEGIMQEFDRGYSEITFSKVACLVRATKAVIYKEYHLSSADPKIAGETNVVPIEKTNFDVLDQLSDMGKEVLHPKASKPFEMHGIPLWIKNTFEPSHEGTVITKEYNPVESRVSLVTGKRNIVIIEIHDALMVGEIGFDHGILGVFKAYGKSYIFKATSGNSITHVVAQKDANDTAFIGALRAKYRGFLMRRGAIICVAGAKIDVKWTLGEVCKVLVLLGIPLYAFSQSYRQESLRFIIGRERYKEAIIALNERLCLRGSDYFVG